MYPHSDAFDLQALKAKIEKTSQNSISLNIGRRIVLNKDLQPLLIYQLHCVIISSLEKSLEKDEL